MPSSLAQHGAVTKLASHLYEFLPGKPHPFANQSISFAGIASSLGLSKFWSGGSKLPAITQLLSLTLEHSPHKFCSLITEIVRRSTVYRSNKWSPLTREEVDQLNNLVNLVGYKIPELYDLNFLDSLPRTKISQGARPTIIQPAELHRLKTQLISLSSLNPQERGYKFENFLADTFEAYGLSPRGAFRLSGEQIDGSFELEGETYLLEARWQNEQMGQEALLVFSGKVGGKAQWSRGVFVSYAGFTQVGLQAFERGKQTNIVCVNGFDLNCTLDSNLDLKTLLLKKVRHAAETNHSFISARDLFPEL